MVDEIKEENERLKGDIKQIEIVLFNGKKPTYEEMLKYKQTIEFEIIGKFAQNLKENLDDFYNSDEDALLDTNDLIDSLVEEFKGELLK